VANRNVLVGIFVLAGLILFTVGIFLVGNRHAAFARHVEFYTEFTNLSGLTTGSKVKVAGMDAGQIVAVGIPDSPLSRFRIRFQINESLRGLVRTDSVVTIATEGVVGGTYVLVRAGSAHAPAAPPMATLPSQEPIDMSKLLERGMVLLQDADTTVSRVGVKLEGALDGVTTTVSNANDVVIGLKHGRGAAGMLLRDETVASDIRQAVTNARQATADVRHASARVDAMTSDLQSRGVTQKTDDTISAARDAAARIKEAASNINGSSKQIHQAIAAATGPDSQGTDAGTNISDSLSNLNTATSNMAEDTEALKHNFFLRGFFRRRGYYNLTHIPSDSYRKDRVFTNPANERAWLSATELFRKSNGGSEIVSAQGKERLNAVIVQFGDSAIDSPIVIEGYSNADELPDQLTSSRHRAIMVREYLRSRFQLGQNTVGVVSMKNSPPDGVGHPHWDGICIVFLSRRQ
jgi:phospholipid/cholesterol/gamma-HCH transport system substrate-binding protein